MQCFGDRRTRAGHETSGGPSSGTQTARSGVPQSHAQGMIHDTRTTYGAVLSPAAGTFSGLRTATLAMCPHRPARQGACSRRTANIGFAGDGRHSGRSDSGRRLAGRTRRHALTAAEAPVMSSRRTFQNCRFDPESGKRSRMEEISLEVKGERMLLMHSNRSRRWSRAWHIGCRAARASVAPMR